MFVRDPVQCVQFLIFFGVLAIYFVNIRTIQYRGLGAMWREIVFHINIVATSVILASLNGRFVFPLFSLEGKRFWLIGTVAITPSWILLEKFWLSVATTLLFTVGLAVLSGRMLNIPRTHLWLSVYSVIMANFGLAGLAVVLGTLYPNFQEDNPARIVSGMGGTLNFLLSMGYIALVVGAQTVILQWRAVERYTRPETFWWALGIVLVFVTVLSVGTALVPLSLGLRNFKHMEF